MDADVSQDGGAQVLDIRDLPVLARGVPPVGEDTDRWVGAMLRAVVGVIADCGERAGWAQIRDGLDAVSTCIREELMLVGLGADLPGDPDDDLRYMWMACPPASRPEDRRRWARVMGAAVLGLMIGHEPPAPDVDPHVWWASMMRGLDVFSAYVRAEGGPLTWPTP